MTNEWVNRRNPFELTRVDKWPKRAIARACPRLLVFAPRLSERTDRSDYCHDVRSTDGPAIRFAASEKKHPASHIATLFACQCVATYQAVWAIV